MNDHFDFVRYPAPPPGLGLNPRGAQVVITARDHDTEVEISSDGLLHANGSYYVQVKITPKREETELC